MSAERNTAAYDTLQELIYGSRLDGCFHPLLIEELLQLSMVFGRKVDHPQDGSKDLANAVAGAVFAAAQEKRIEIGRLFGELIVLNRRTHPPPYFQGCHIVDTFPFGEPSTVASLLALQRHRRNDPLKAVSNGAQSLEEQQQSQNRPT